MTFECRQLNDSIIEVRGDEEFAEQMQKDANEYNDVILFEKVATDTYRMLVDISQTEGSDEGLISRSMRYIH